MKKQISIIVGLLALGSAGIHTAHAQPPEAVPLEVRRAEAQLKVQRAEASAQIMAFGTETMRSQLTPEEFARWPLALRDALPYGLHYQPFEAWSPELQQFALGKFQSLAADPKVENFAPAAKNKAAISRWLQEKAPFENAQMLFHLLVRFGVNVKNQDGVVQLKTARNVEFTTRDARLIVVFGRLLGSLSSEQKSELFANKMRLPIARFNPEQKQMFDELLGNDPNIATVPIPQLLKSDIAIDFQFSTQVQRVIDGKKEDFYVGIARPFDYLFDYLAY